MATTELRPRSTDNATGRYWKLDGLRTQLTAAAQEYSKTDGDK